MNNCTTVQRVYCIMIPHCTNLETLLYSKQFVLFVQFDQEHDRC